MSLVDIAVQRKVATVIARLDTLERETEQAGYHSLSDALKRANRELLSPGVLADLEDVNVNAVRY